LLTSGKRQRLRVDLADFKGNSRYAEYDNFKVDSASDKYKLSSLGTYSGTAGRLDCSRSTAVHCYWERYMDAELLMLSIRYLHL